MIDSTYATQATLPESDTNLSAGYAACRCARCLNQVDDAHPVGPLQLLHLATGHGDLIRGRIIG